MTHLRPALATVWVTTLIACSSSGTSGEGTPEVTSPTTGARVTATISAATLGDQCAASEGPAAAPAACAAPPDGGLAKDSNECGRSSCRKSGVQIAFSVGAGSGASKVEIVSVTLHDLAGQQLDALTATSPRSWSGEAYVAWDQTLAAGTDLKTSYELSGPRWSTLGSDTYSQKYRLRVTLDIDGAKATIQSDELSRLSPLPPT